MKLHYNYTFVNMLILFINSYEARGSSVALEECSSKMADFQQRTKNKMTERKEIDDKLDTLRKQLANAKVMSCDYHVMCLLP